MLARLVVMYRRAHCLLRRLAGQLLLMREAVGESFQAPRLLVVCEAGVKQ